MSFQIGLLARGRVRRLLCLLLFFVFFGQSLASARELKVLTFNTWLLNIGPIEWAQDIDERIALIPPEVRALDADLVLLQEVWADEYKEKLVNGFYAQGYSHFAWTPNESNGLLIVSRFPILQQKVLVFSDFTNFEERFKNKGAIYVELDIPGIGFVDVYNTHMGSIDFFVNDKKFNSQHERTVKKQIHELLEFVAKTHHNDTWIVGGDFNFHYDAWLVKKFWPVPSELYDAVVKNFHFDFRLYDNFRWTRNREESPPFTYGSENPYVKNDQAYKGPDVTLDYVFTNQSPKSRLQAKYSKRVFAEAPKAEHKNKLGLRKLPKRLSDHFGILVKFAATAL